MIEVREVLRAWLAGDGLRKVQLTDEMIGAVVAAVLPARPSGDGPAW